MDWLTQNWMWIALALLALFMVRRGGMGCGMGHGHVRSRAPAIERGDSASGDSTPRASEGANGTAKAHRHGC